MTRVQPIRFAEVETLSFRQIDELNGVPKGASFRLFKKHLAALSEGKHYFHVSGDTHHLFMAELKRSEKIYASSVSLVLLTREGYQLLLISSKDRSRQSAQGWD